MATMDAMALMLLASMRREYHTVVFGPGGIAQAHTSDEWIDLHEVEVASVVFQELIKRVLMTRN